ncbi:hypothetical protein M3Y14_33845 (plasmid) [Bacillus thuringiensis]|uniref:hypothetical protein n=1 Tax=Bacillus thuringiensis TaxID=1428 RepID=UPI00222462DD|nr:hypothetical protein [Bacillus thuringiensis]UYX56237.1 hypothetical protein M3Y14_33845 [Bacillus thuringiensis]
MPNPYLASNQPYQRVDNGITGGAIMGASIGAKAAGSAHLWGQKGIDAFRRSSATKTANSYSNMMNGASSNPQVANALKEGHAAQVSKHATNMKGAFHAEKLHNKAFGGGWKSKAVAYGGSVLAGGILGAGVGAISD